MQLHSKRPGEQVSTVCIFELKICSTNKTEQLWWFSEQSVQSDRSKGWYVHEVPRESIKVTTPSHVQTTHGRCREVGETFSHDSLVVSRLESLYITYIQYIQYIQRLISCGATPIAGQKAATTPRKWLIKSLPCYSLKAWPSSQVPTRAFHIQT